MLGWFRKKKKEEVPVPQPAEQEIFEEGSAADESSEVPVTSSEPEEIAEQDEEAEELEIATVAEESEEEPSSLQSGQEKPVAVSRKGDSLFSRLQAGLSKTRKSLVYRLDTLFLGKKEIDQELFDDLEEILITADLGVSTVQELLEEVRIEVKRRELQDPMALKNILGSKIRGHLVELERAEELSVPVSGPLVIMVVGVNGVGKTTSIGKIAAKFVRAGQSVLLVAGDTFRAAAIDQLKIWGERCGVEVVAQKTGSDPSSVVFDAMEIGKARKYDVILIDTAGRLHTQVNLMEELKKIKRVISKKIEGAPHEVMLVLDATTGQNGISQARLFNEAVGVTGVTLTKLDGTAKGGIVINICRELQIPVRFIGIGEQIDDLRDFDANEFVDALFENGGSKAAAA